MRLFLYGSLLDPAVLAARAGRQLRLAPAVLVGWRRVARASSRFPTLRRQRGARVEGAVTMAGGAALARLAAYEGPDYRLRRIAVRRARDDTVGTARVWIAPGGTRRSWP
jgi:gamma-glutamylcyclotransferase (GGCT)/AIG2-like uncharacterized protein YtfP